MGLNPEIPEGIHYSDEHDNFYNNAGAGMGQAFYDRWKEFSHLFPTQMTFRRKSILTRSDCQYLHRLMSECQKEFMEFAARGFKEQGLGDDQMAVVHLLTLEKAMTGILAKIPERKTP